MKIRLATFVKYILLPAILVIILLGIGVVGFIATISVLWKEVSSW